MGQYYKPTIVGTGEYVKMTWLKLMEHSWMLNGDVAKVEMLLIKGAPWHGKKIVWAGDYADGEVDKKGKPIMYKSGDKEYEVTLYTLATKELKPVVPKNFHKPKRIYRFMKNKDTKEFVDLEKVPNKDGWRIHPLPLMTCEGNGGGGGDFYGEDPNELVGRWARNRVVMQKRKPRNAKEIIFDLIE